MSGRMSRNKGKAGERELSRRLSQLLKVQAYRSQQFSGANHDGDVSGVPGIHVECKRCESGSMYKWIEQAVSDSKADDVPVVFHRKNGKQWLVICELDDLVNLARAVVEIVGID